MTSEQRRMKLNEVARRGVSVPVSAHPDLERAVPGRDTWAWSWWSYVRPRPTAAAWTDRPDTSPPPRRRGIDPARLSRPAWSGNRNAHRPQRPHRPRRMPGARNGRRSPRRISRHGSGPISLQATRRHRMPIWNATIRVMKDDQMRRQADQARARHPPPRSSVPSCSPIGPAGWTVVRWLLPGVGRRHGSERIRRRRESTAMTNRRHAWKGSTEAANDRPGGVAARCDRDRCRKGRRGEPADGQYLAQSGSALYLKTFSKRDTNYHCLYTNKTNK